MSREHVATYAHTPSSKTRIRLEVERAGITQVIETETVLSGHTAWVRDIDEPPPIRTEAELIDKLYQGARHHGYLQALLKAWACVVRLRGGGEIGRA